MKVVFFGTSSFAAETLRNLLDHRVHIVAVVTRIDKPKGRRLELSPPPVKESILKNYPELPLLQPSKASTPEFAQVLRSYDPDLFVVVAYGEILRPSILEIPRRGCVNIHASLLPLYRGAAPMQRALMEGAVETGITLIEMSAQMDAGDILAMQSIPVTPEMTLGDLEPKLCALGSNLVLQYISDLEQGHVCRYPQDHSRATFAPKIAPDEMRIDWKCKASVLHNLIRALSPIPGAWCVINIGGEKKRLKIKRAVVSEERGVPGDTLRRSVKEWVVACGEGALSLLEVQLEGKKTMLIGDFLRGTPSELSLVDASIC